MVNPEGLEWFGPPECNTLCPLCVVLLVLSEVENGIVRSESELLLCLVPTSRLAFESLACAASASFSYLKGGAYMAVESPTSGPNDVV
jgi:hypothetical protein